MALTLVKMAEGGIYDQLGGGFARYSTDAHWLVPHFEKMLYDNAQLLVLASETWQMTREPTLERVVRETIAYIERDLRAPEGGFYTAEDADSEGVEGKFYVWTPDEVRAAVGAAGIDMQAADVFMRCFDVSAEGNWNDPHGHGPVNASILHVVDRPRGADEERMLADVKAVLLRRASKRVRPGLDDKVLAGNNGMAIAGLAEAGRIFGDAAFVDGARRTAEFVLAHMTEGIARAASAHVQGGRGEAAGHARRSRPRRRRPDRAVRGDRRGALARGGASPDALVGRAVLGARRALLLHDGRR